MFTTPPYTPTPGGFQEGIANRDYGSLLRAGWLNYVSGQFPKALDAIDGGYYQFVGDIRFSSDTKQIKINAPAVLQPTKLLGYTTIGLSDDVNYATGQGTLTVAIPSTFSAAATFSAGVTYSGAITYSNTVQFNGAVTVNAATTFTNNGDITLQSGCTLNGASGFSIVMDSGSTTTINGAATLAGTNTISGATTISGTATLSNTTTVSGAFALTGRRVMFRPRVALTDADHTVDVTQGDRFALAAGAGVPAAPRTITLDYTTGTPIEGETLTFMWFPRGNTTAAGSQFFFRRSSDNTLIATFDGSPNFDVDFMWAEFEFTGGEWRVGLNYGTHYDGTNEYGVIAGPSA